uniref:Uncharacterized protein n=1 Tax=Arundo donax TaxID=35708 RepID=A0A0A9BU21_ARUDO
MATTGRTLHRPLGSRRLRHPHPPRLHLRRLAAPPSCRTRSQDRAVVGRGKSTL